MTVDEVVAALDGALQRKSAEDRAEKDVIRLAFETSVDLRRHYVAAFFSAEVHEIQPTTLFFMAGWMAHKQHSETLAQKERQ